MVVMGEEIREETVVVSGMFICQCFPRRDDGISGRRAALRCTATCRAGQSRCDDVGLLSCMSQFSSRTSPGQASLVDGSRGSCRHSAP